MSGVRSRTGASKPERRSAPDASRGAPSHRERAPRDRGQRHAAEREAPEREAPQTDPVRREASPPRVASSGHDDAPVVVRQSPCHGFGLFATREIPAGTRVLEYTGERISHAEAADRYDDADGAHVHTLLFTVDRRTVIDGAVGGGSGRYVNHSCDPNCEVTIERGRIFFDTLRSVPAGAELTYDYALTRPYPLPRDWRTRYACWCDATSCRGTMLARPPRARRRRPRPRSA